MRVRLWSLWFILAAAFAGCGGGGGDSAAPVVTGPQAFQLRTAWHNHVANAVSLRFSAAGTVNGAPVSGSGSLTLSGLSAAGFEGRAAFVKAETRAGTLTVAGTAVPFSETQQFFFDAADNPLGRNADAYGVVAGPVSIPAVAAVGDVGILYSADLYGSSAKLARTGTAQVSFALRADTATTALLSVATETRSTSGGLISTETVVFRITPAGEVTRLSDSSVVPGSNTNLTFSY